MEKSKYFIAFEGGDGVGKSTISKLLYEHLKTLGLKVILTREPGGTENGEKIRELMLSDNKWSKFTEFSLVMAARAEHVEKVILPALQNQTYIICDRFVDSTAVYQGLVNQLGVDLVYEIHEKYFGKLYPYLTFMLDLPVEEASKRAQARGNMNRFDKADNSVKLQIYDGFRSIAQLNSDRCKIIDASLDKDKILNYILTSIQ